MDKNTYISNKKHPNTTVTAVGVGRKIGLGMGQCVELENDSGNRGKRELQLCKVLFLKDYMEI